MAFFEQSDLHDLYKLAKEESYEWRRPYKEYERIADNGLLDDLDEVLPETNDGSLAAGLYKLPKRVVKNNLEGRFESSDRDEAWITELANIYWKNKILPNANTDAPYKRKVKDVVRKAAIYGGQPVINLLVDDGKGGSKADFIVPYCQDVRLEPGKVSDQASDIIFWDVYYTRKQIADMIEQAKDENGKSDGKGENTVNQGDGYNKWNIEALQAIYDSKDEGEDRDQNEDHDSKDGLAVKKGGVKFCIAFQRGVKAPFYMYHHSTNKVVREWENPDPTGDIPVKYLYCYQDFINPYGVGIVKLAGGTQNVLDIMRMYDVYATQIGVRSPRVISGNEDEVDEDSMVYAPDANWYVGNAKVDRWEMANGVYNQLPTRIQMYQSSLNKFMPIGDSTVSASAGDPMQSKTPAGVKQAQAMLSIDDEDFIDNLYEWWEQVATNLINLTFANMQGSDILKLSDDEMKLLADAGLEIPMGEMGTPLTNELEVLWDETRSTFTFQMDAEKDADAEKQEKREALTAALELRAADPNFDMTLMQSGWKFDLGETYATLMGLIVDNDKIITRVSPEDQAMMDQQMMGQAEPMENTQPQTEEEAMATVEAVMQQYGVDQETALEALMSEEAGVDPEQIKQVLTEAGQAMQGAMNA